MAINNGSLYIGNATNSIALIEKQWQPIPYLGKHKISINGASTFKVKDESTFFGIQSANTTVKNKAYNDLRFQFNNLGEIIRGILPSQLLGFSYSDPQWSTYDAIRADTTVKNLGISRQVNSKLNAYSFNNLVKVYITCTFDDVNLIAKLKYPSIGAEFSYV